MITRHQFFERLTKHTESPHGANFLAIADDIKQMSVDDCIKCHNTMQRVSGKSPEAFTVIDDEIRTILGMLRTQVYALSPMHLPPGKPVTPQIRFLSELGIYFGDKKLFNLDASLDALKKTAASLDTRTIKALHMMVSSNPFTSTIATQQEMDAVFDEVLATKE